MQIIFCILSFIVGACIGSFLCCQARRLHYSEHHKSQITNPRSICLHCRRQLKWYDNLPILSWLFLRGKCRFCHHSIGIAELLSELACAVGFTCLAATSGLSSADVLAWFNFLIIIVFTSVISFLAIYDGLYGELPTKYLIAAIIIGFFILILHIVIATSTGQTFTPELIYQPFFSVLLLGGLYLVLYLISHGRWVGDGDWLLATALALVVGHPWLALFILFLANFLACIIMLPFLGRSKSHHIYFGPFLVVAFVVVYSFATPLLGLLHFIG